VDEAFLRLQVALAALRERRFSDDGISADTASEISTQVNNLQDLFAAPQSSNAEADYARSLDRAAAAITTAAFAPDAATANASLRLLQRDLRLKVDSARATLGAGGRDPTAIEVVVTTTRQGHPSNGYLIRASDAIDGDVPPTHIFNNPTNPSTRAWLIPGIYYIHVYQGSRRVLRQEFDIDERSHDLIVALP
jgi:hypothetical protein